MGILYRCCWVDSTACVNVGVARLVTAPTRPHRPRCPRVLYIFLSTFFKLATLSSTSPTTSLTAACVHSRRSPNASPQRFPIFATSIMCGS
jgi:hypothetical protein